MRVYLETSYVSACVTTRTDPSSLHRRKESREWWESERHKHELLVSTEVIAELSDPDYPTRTDAANWIQSVPILDVTEEMLGFAKVLIAERVMPQPLKGDAVHVAAATVARAEYILSWNVRHLANPNKRVHLAKICMRFGLVPPTIITPELLWEE
jgi:hypothetical protein